MVIKNQKKILPLILIIIIIIVGVLAYFYSRGKKPINNQALVSSLDIGVLQGQELNISESGKDLLKSLKVLKSVKLDTNFFEQEVFKGLVDYSQELPFEEKGRLNPFRPIGI